ncbi:MAG: adenylyl-sulfate reductase [Hyphomicrobiales bacterium]|nr:MAG: adenylyl-sulfate reductase [Hyphomicrobiales bacterium]
MFTINPFSELSELIPSTIQQIYVIAMAILVVGGTALDVMHKASGKYFSENWKKSKKNAVRNVGSGEMVAMAVKTGLGEVMTSSEFANVRRRISHLFTMYGFILFIVTTVIMVFVYGGADASTPAIWPLLWHLGALSLCFGGYWFWFAIRVDVSAEGKPWYKLCRADIFILSLLATATFGLIWSFMQSVDAGVWEILFLALFIVASTVLFGTVLWSKFAHMFFKPAAAFQKRVTKADGSAENLPVLTRDDPEQRARHSMSLLVDAPMDMGLGIKREAPRHY